MTRKPPDRLYGLPGGDRLHGDPAGVWEFEVAPYLDDDNLGPWLIEEWTVRRPIDTLPPPGWLVESCAEHADDELALGETSLPNLEADATVMAAARYLVALIASRAVYFGTDRLVAVHRLELTNPEAIHDYDVSLAPTLDGLPLYRPRPSERTR